MLGPERLTAAGRWLQKPHAARNLQPNGPLFYVILVDDDDDGENHAGALMLAWSLLGAARWKHPYIILIHTLNFLAGRAA